MKYGVWCEVWGGVTGHRMSWMKANGVEREFATREEAQAAADEATRRTMGDAHRTANYSYMVRPRLTGH